jgi:hypothetical protein
MIFDDEAIEVAAKAATPMQWVDLPEQQRLSAIQQITEALDAAIASMKSRGIDPCMEARKAEKERCAKIAATSSDTMKKVIQLIDMARKAEREQCAQVAMACKCLSCCLAIRAMEDEP